jgi:hypothetical protein
MSAHQSHQRVRPTAVQALPSWDALGDLSGAFRSVPGMVFAAVPLVPRASLVRRPPVQPRTLPRAGSHLARITRAAGPHGAGGCRLPAQPRRARAPCANAAPALLKCDEGD